MLRSEIEPDLWNGRHSALCSLYKSNEVLLNDDLIKIQNANTAHQFRVLFNQSKQNSGKRFYGIFDALLKRSHQSNLDINNTNATLIQPKNFNSKSKRASSALLIPLKLNRTGTRINDTFTTNKTAQIKTSTTTTLTKRIYKNNCNNNKQRHYKTHRNFNDCVEDGNDDDDNDGYNDCITTTTTNKNNNTEWYIQLASKCYNGIQLHLNYLDECAKRNNNSNNSKGEFEKKLKPIYERHEFDIQLPSLALLSRSFSKDDTVDNKSRFHRKNDTISNTTQFKTINDTVSCATDFIVHSTPKSNNTNCELIDWCASNNNTRLGYSKCIIDYSSIGWDKNRLCNDKFNDAAVAYKTNWSIKNNNRSSTAQQYHPSFHQHQQQICALNAAAKNNMNSIAIDANNIQLHNNDPQLTNQPFHGYHDSNANNFLCYQEFQQQQSPTINGEHSLWLRRHNSQHIQDNCLIQSNQSPDANDLIKVFSRSLNLEDTVTSATTLTSTLPQIVLSDFSSDQPTPPTTPLIDIYDHQSSTLPESPAISAATTINGSTFLSIVTK